MTPGVFITIATAVHSLPEAPGDTSSETVALTASLAIIGMLVVQVLLR